MNRLRQFFLAGSMLAMLAGAAPGATLHQWDFKTASDGWTANDAQVQTLADQGVQLSSTGTDPQWIGPPMEATADVRPVVTLRLRSETAGPAQLFWGTEFSEDQKFTFTLSGDGKMRDYVFELPPLTAGSRLRLDPFDSVGRVEIESIAVTNPEPPAELRVDNGTLTIGMNTKIYGGAITYLSLSGQDHNIINIADKGRQIQQSYYAGKSLDRRDQGQSPSWSPWTWNPIQVGDAGGHPARVVEARVEGNVAYTRTLPTLWDMTNRELGQCFMEQWTELQGSTVHVRNRLTIYRDPNDPWGEATGPTGQEAPAIYNTAELNFLMTYTGKEPWTGAPADEIVNGRKRGDNSGFIWARFTPTEPWAANLDKPALDGWGLAVYQPKAHTFLGGTTGPVKPNHRYDPKDGMTSYIAPLTRATIKRDAIYDFDYYLIVGNLGEIRAKVYELAGKPAPQTQPAQ